MRWFGAKPVTHINIPNPDDTAAIQNAIMAAGSAAQHPGQPTGSGRVFFPAGKYTIKDTLTYRGNYNVAIVLEGEAAGNVHTAVLTYDGDAGGTMLELKGANSSRINTLAFNGNGKAKLAIVIDGDYDSDVKSFNCTLNEVTVFGITGTESAAIKVGSSPAMAAAEVTFNNVCVTGYGGLAYGIWIAAEGNVKNFRFYGGGVSGANVGLKGSSGYTILHGFSFTNNSRTDIEVNTPGQLEVTSCNSEGSGSFLKTSSNFGANPSTVMIKNCAFESAAMNPDEVVVWFSGAGGVLFLEGNTFVNTATQTSQVLVVAKSRVISRGNWYRNALTTAPIWDGGGNNYFSYPGEFDGETNPGAARSLVLESFADYGGNYGNIVSLTPRRLGSDTGILGISVTPVMSKNLRGSTTFAGTSSSDVNFLIAEPDDKYHLSFSANANETIWWSSKTATGFTLNSSNPASTAVVHWHLIR